MKDRNIDTFSPPRLRRERMIALFGLSKVIKAEMSLVS